MLNRISKSYAYNPLTSPFHNAKVSKDKQKELNDKVEVHRINADIVSEPGYLYGITKT